MKSQSVPARGGRIVVDAGAGALRLVAVALLPGLRRHGLGSHMLRALHCR